MCSDYFGQFNVSGDMHINDSAEMSMQMLFFAFVRCGSMVLICVGWVGN
jgi:hypothetical protein